MGRRNFGNASGNWERETLVERRKCGNAGEIPSKRNRKKIKIKENAKRTRKDLKKEREKVASNENMQKRKKYLQEGINVRGGG